MQAYILLLAALWLLFAYIISKVIYNIFLHPLRSFPGPLFARATLIEYQRQTLKGYSHLWFHELHKNYGPVIRFSPNQLSFIEPEVWKDVYGHRASAFIKDLKYFYGPDSFGTPTGIIRADNVGHARQRKLVSHAFSDKALRDQEQLLKGYVGILIGQLKGIALASKDTDLVKWYNFTTFDIMADLTFGESLNQLSSSMYSSWVESTFASVKFIIFGRIGREWGLEKLLGRLIPADVRRKRDNHVRFAAGKVDKRMAEKTERPDIWTYVTRHSEGQGSLTQSELHSNGATFMLAGTETTATALSGMTYMLLKNPALLDRLTKEVRNAFTSLEDMTMTKLSQLEYMHAVIEEGLRMYPPVANGLPRVTPKDGANVCGHWIPGGTIVQGAFYSAARSATNFVNPEKFAPERHLPEGADEYAADKKDAFTAFSFGPRNCVGKNLAYHEMRLILASVLLHFDLELSSKEDDWMDQPCHFLWDKKPLMVRLKPVE